MGGGLLQLVAYGAQDVYLTGNPQITFWKVSYRRYTNFSMETIEQSLSGSSQIPATGTGRATCTISRNGDLVHRVYVTSDSAGITSGPAIINEVEVEIGGQRIDKQLIQWMQCWWELSTPDSKAMGLKSMMGGIGSTGTTGVERVQIPLTFWFCRNPGLALPLIALQYHEVKLNFTWNGGNIVGAQANVQVWADYIFLDTDERRRMAQNPHEYLIDQVQTQTVGTTEASHELHFNHPVKELVWATTPQTGGAKYTATLKLNGHDRFAEQPSDYFQLRQPYDYHTAVPRHNIPTLESPVMLETPIAVMTAVATVAGGGNPGDDEFAINNAANNNLTLQAGEADDIDIQRGDILSISYPTATGVEQQLVARVAAVVTAPEDGENAVYSLVFTGGVGADNTPENSVIGFGSINIIARSQVFEKRSRTSKLDQQINVYSFALRPEEHQPSGTCNFSRIDSAVLRFSANTPTISDIYAVNYNVLRIMSGMGGLAYSN